MDRPPAPHTPGKSHSASRGPSGRAWTQGGPVSGAWTLPPPRHSEQPVPPEGWASGGHRPSVGSPCQPQADQGWGWLWAPGGPGGEPFSASAGPKQKSAPVDAQGDLPGLARAPLRAPVVAETMTSPWRPVTVQSPRGCPGPASQALAGGAPHMGHVHPCIWASHPGVQAGGDRVPHPLPGSPWSPNPSPRAQHGQWLLALETSSGGLTCPWVGLPGNPILPCGRPARWVRGRSPPLGPLGSPAAPSRPQAERERLSPHCRWAPAPFLGAVAVRVRCSRP